ncbi:MAG: universal stress protein [Planctomycetota bacterium]|nr:universal stress protein [Planctomycetota bacterium]
MYVSESRPRDLKWFHAGPLLFGDWGTSRLYVLGLAFYYTAHASVLYLSVMSVIMAAVAWGYTIACRCFPDGGGVYAASRQLSPILSVVGATLLICDYTVTAALSAVEGFHYFGVPSAYVVPASIVTMLALGILNWLGARAAGRFALVIAVVALGVSAFIAMLCLPLIPAGLSSVTPNVEGVTSPWDRWESLVRIVLALSGVEAVANMTGLMRQPVARTAKRTIWPVLFEVVLLNLIFCIALNALPSLRDQQVPHYVALELRQGVASDQVPQEVRAYRDTALNELAEHAGTSAMGERGGSVLRGVSGIVFGLLLLSAVNTAIMAMVSVFYSMARDRELPSKLAKLNYSGVPWIGLVLAVALPCGVLLFEADPKSLGELYAIGVVGAITINLGSCAANRKLPIARWERIGLWTIAGVMGLVELTIIYAKMHATIFAGSLIGAALLMRFAIRASAPPAKPRDLPEPQTGWLGELRSEPIKPGLGKRIMLAARGQDQAAYAVDLAKRENATLFAIFVRTLRLLDVTPSQAPKIEDDPDAQAALGTVAVLARRAGVPFVPIYVTSADVAAEILDYTVTFGCETLIMGKTRRGLFSRRVEGDVVAKVAASLPDEVSLISRGATTTPTDVSAGATYQDPVRPG